MFVLPRSSGDFYVIFWTARPREGEVPLGGNLDLQLARKGLGDPPEVFRNGSTPKEIDGWMDAWMDI